MIIPDDCHLFVKLMSSLLISGSAGVSNGVPIRKCPGVNGLISSGFSLDGLRGLELRHDSILANRVDNSSNVCF